MTAWISLQKCWIGKNLYTRVGLANIYSSICVCSIITITRYWELKKEMAAGSEPFNIRIILDQLRPLCAGLALCGAGAGGFAAVVLTRDHTLADLQSCVESINGVLLARNGASSDPTSHDDLLSAHTAEIDWHGIQSTVHCCVSRGGSNDEAVLLEDFLR